MTVPPQMFNHETFQEYFCYSLRPTEWWQAISNAALTISRKERATIVELFPTRPKDDNDWALHGRTVEVWDWMAKESGGRLKVHAVSDTPAVAKWGPENFANVEFNVVKDAMAWVQRHKREFATCDLLHLNSPDDHTNGAALSTVFSKLRPGAMVMCATGRNHCVSGLFAAGGKPPDVNGPMRLWRVK